MSNKTPYEIRFDLASMAQGILETKRQTDETIFFTKLDAMKETHPSKDEMMAWIEDNKPVMYSEKDILEKATYLYDNFVAVSSTANIKQ
jgi:hypothetical protein